MCLLASPILLRGDQAVHQETELETCETELQRRVVEDEELAKSAIREYREALQAVSKCGPASAAMKNRVMKAVSRYQTSLKELSRLRNRESGHAS